MIAQLISLVVAMQEPGKQFDLACQRHEGSNPQRLFEPERFRVDLDASKWCVGECGEMHPMRVTENKLFLEREEKPRAEPTTPGERMAAEIARDITTVAAIDRRSGVYTYQVLNKGMVYSETTAQCEVKPYSGPGAKRLF